MPTRLVIVDTDAILRLDLSQLLAQLGYLVVGEAGDAQSARTLVQALQPDLVLLDSALAGPVYRMAGAESWVDDPITPILLMGFNDGTLAEQVAHTGGAGYLIKPRLPHARRSR